MRMKTTDRYVDNERGIALLMALILALVAFIFTTTLIYMVTQGTIISGIQKRYSNVLDCAKGGVEIATQVINKGGQSGSYGGLFTLSYDQCLEDKIYSKTADWLNCSNDRASLDISTAPDLSLNIGNCTVSIKILDTIEGNSPPAQEFLVGKGVVETQGLGVGPSFPYEYTVGIESSSSSASTKKNETAQIELLYAH